jgi:GT2 family glycosyltransferase
MVSIIILAHNQLKFTKQCLSSLLSFTSQIQTPYETIVVDNASTDGTKEYLQGLEQSGQIKVIYNTENKGFPTANNQAAAIAKGEYLCLCNNDIVFTQDWLVKLLRCIKSDNTLVAVGPYTSHSSGYQQVRPQPTYKGEEDLQKYAAKFSDEEKYVDFLVFFCVLIKRKIWDEIGGLNECYGRGCFEDNEFNYRVVQKGYKMKLAGDCFVHHYSGMTFGQKESPQKTKEYASLLAKNQRIFLKNVDRYETISLIMICADSEKPETLKKCLDSVCEFVDEICIVFNYKYYPQPWKIKKLKSIYEKLGVPTFSLYIKFTNFSDMRNRSINMATSRYVLWMDADDTCQTPIGIRDIILLNPHIDVFKWRILSYTERKTIETILHSRLFRRMKNNKVPQWINRCHEDIAYSMNELDYTHSITDLTIPHWGYVNRESWHKKNVRNLKLMQQDIDEIKAKIEPSKNDQGRMSMIYYGIVNSLIILASRQRSKRKYKTLVQALNTTD